MRRAGLALVLTALLLVPAIQAQAEWRPRFTLLGWINDVRVRDLTMGRMLSNLAIRHAHRMEAQGRVFHSDYRPCSYHGENVGAVGAGRLRDLFGAFMDSPAHRRNMLDWHFRRIGIGVAAEDGIAYVVLIFCR